MRLNETICYSATVATVRFTAIKKPQLYIYIFDI